MYPSVLDRFFCGAFFGRAVEAIALGLCQDISAALQFCDSSFYPYHTVFVTCSLLVELITPNTDS